MILLATAAWADPGALRAPERAPAAVIGLHETSIAAPIGPVDVALEFRTDGGAAGASVGLRRTLTDGDRGWRTAVGVSGGLALPLVDPTVGLSVTAWSSAGVIGRRGYAQGLVAVPAVFSPAGVRVPLMPELQAGVALGPLLIGPRLSFAVVLSDVDTSIATEAALGLTWAPRR